MPGIYIHIPFCHSRCHYCNFFATASSKDRQGFSKYLVRELKMRKEFLSDKQIDTIYFGGGTPSILEPWEIDKILDEIDRSFQVDENVEVTLEVNPEDVSKAKCRAWVESGINRLSMGVQSFRDEDLQYLKRIHDSKKALNAIRLALGNGFENLSIDLIYGIPGQSDQDWLLNLNTLFSLRLPHFSAYSLTVEPGTPLHHSIQKKKADDVDEELAARHFNILSEESARQGYEHYEVSNLAIPGQYSRHNRSYWQGKPYLGIGPSAHSFNTKVRAWNPSSIGGYIKALNEGKLPEGKEGLSIHDQFNEFIMLGLRTIWGCSYSEIEKRFGEERRSLVEETSKRFIEKGWMSQEKGIIKLSREGLFRADGIAAEFFSIGK